jgi:adenine/guanine phosphoribosyltransferase-like PRPP-binding protein
MQIKDHIRQIPDFPKPGILFYDISTLLAHAKAWHHTMHLLADKVKPHKPDLLVGIESTPTIWSTGKTRLRCRPMPSSRASAL